MDVTDYIPIPRAALEALLASYPERAVTGELETRAVGHECQLGLAGCSAMAIGRSADGLFWACGNCARRREAMRS